MSSYSRNYTDYLGSKKCCNISQGVEGPQGPQGTKGPIGPAGTPGPTGPSSSGSIDVSTGSTGYGNVLVVNLDSTDPSGNVKYTPILKISETNQILASGDFIPTIPGTSTEGYNLGSELNPWKKLYISKNTIEFTGDITNPTTGTIGLDDRKKHYEHAKHVLA